MIDSIKETYKYYRDRAFLKKHGCETWDEYNRRYDPDYNIRATRIKDIYHGYPWVYCFENREHFAYTLLYDYGPGGCHYGYNDIISWCNDNLSDKFRFDGHRVHKQTPIGNNGVEDSEWFINEISGGDYIFAAFKSESDYLWFLLRWT